MLGDKFFASTYNRNESLGLVFRLTLFGALTFFGVRWLVKALDPTRKQNLKVQKQNVGGDMFQLKNFIKEVSNLNEKNVIDEIKNALQENDLDAYNKWREDEFNVNHVFNDRYTLLHLATVKNNMNVMNALIKKGANVSVVDEFKRTPLHIASSKGLIEAIIVLIENGANINAVSDCGYTPLHAAIKGAPRELETHIVKCLIQNGANVNTACNENRMTPLHSVIISKSNIDTVKILIGNGANVNALDIYNDTPLHYSANFGCLEIVQTLIENDAVVNAKNKLVRETPLHLAAKKNHLEVVKYLLDNGADIKSQDIGQKTPIDSAEIYGCKEIVDYLEDRTARNAKRRKISFPSPSRE